MSDPGAVGYLEGLRRAVALAALLCPGAGPAWADDVLPARVMALELARDIAQGAVDACRDAGYQVSAVVVDRDGFEQVVLRDVYASRFTVQIARDKANAVILSGIASGEFRANRADIRTEMNHVDGILMLDGGVPIEAAGSLLGAVGVSGAPGGDKDAACARAGLEAVAERLQFID